MLSKGSFLLPILLASIFGLWWFPENVGAQSNIDPLRARSIRNLLEPDVAEQFLMMIDESYDLFDGFSVKSILAVFQGGKATNESCHQCEQIMALASLLQPTQDSVKLITEFGCQNLPETVSKRECEGLIERLGLPILYILNNTKVPADQRCSVLLGHECDKYLNTPIDKWTFWELPIPKKPSASIVGNVVQKTPTRSPSVKKYKVLHLTDVHLDLFYSAGSNAKCHEALCCRITSYVFDNQTTRAGLWGQVDGDCDMPLNMVTDSLQQIHAQHPDIDLVFWTGDNVPHDVWNTSIENCLEHNRVMSDLVKKVFGQAQVIPVLGNHEAHPINMYVPIEVTEHMDRNYSMEWLYNTLADDYWAQWLPEDSMKQTFKRGGYYSTMVTPKWKVIVLNSNHGYIANFWRALNPIDPDGQLAWLIKELQQAETNGQFVSLLGHIPPSNMYQAWLHNYIRIVDRFQHVITGAYMGHTHDDELSIMYNEDDQPVGVNYISGSLTTFSYLNPSYKIFEMDSNGKPLNYDVFYLELDEDNDHTARNHSIVPVWLHEFNAKQAYQLKSLTVAQWDLFWNRTMGDLDMAYDYAEHYHRHSDEYREVTELDAEKIHKMIKRIKTVSPFHKKNENLDF